MHILIHLYMDIFIHEKGTHIFIYSYMRRAFSCIHILIYSHTHISSCISMSVYISPSYVPMYTVSINLHPYEHRHQPPSGAPSRPSPFHINMFSYIQILICPSYTHMYTDTDINPPLGRAFSPLAFSHKYILIYPHTHISI